MEIVVFETKKTVLGLPNSRSDAEPRGSRYDGVSAVRKGFTVFVLIGCFVNCCVESCKKL